MQIQICSIKILGKRIFIWYNCSNQMKQRIEEGIKMDWLELIVDTHTESVEAISAFLMELGSKGVSIEDPADYFQLTQEQREWLSVKQATLYEQDSVVVKAYFTPQQWQDRYLQEVEWKLQELATFGLRIGKGKASLQVVGETDWADAWKKYYFPVRVTRYLTVVPSWLDYTKEQEDERLIRLDPGLAFGTGTHPTTQLSLAAMEQYVRGGERLLDVGTGSGVLSIAAKLLGAKHVIAFDIDEMATRVAKENIALNDTIGAIAVFENHLLSGIDQEADVIVANILAEILVQMPSDAYRNLTDTGVLILSGIIDAKAIEVQQVYEEAGFQLKEKLTMSEWNCLVFVKNNDKED